MQKGVILGCGNRSNARMDTVTLSYNTTLLSPAWQANMIRWISPSRQPMFTMNLREFTTCTFFIDIYIILRWYLYDTCMILAWIILFVKWTRILQCGRCVGLNKTYFVYAFKNNHIAIGLHDNLIRTHNHGGCIQRPYIIIGLCIHHQVPIPVHTNPIRVVFQGVHTIGHNVV